MKNKLFFLLLIFSSCRKDPYPFCPNPIKLDGWRMYTNCIKLEENTSGFYFLNENTGFITGFYGMIKRTDDRGVTWKDISTNQETVIEGISFINSDTGYVSLRSMGDTTINDLEVTYDGGKHWNIIPISMHGYLSDIHFFNFHDAVAVFTDRTNGKKIIYTTNDGANTWHNSGVHIMYNGINWNIFYSSETLFAGEQDNNRLLKSTDKGYSWNQIIIPVQDLSGVNIIDSMNFFVEGWNGDSLKTFRTFNGGATWTEMSDSFNYSFYHVFSDKLRGIAVSHSPFNPYFSSNDSIVYKYYSTSDGGTNWTQIGESNQENYFNSTWQFPSDNVGYSINGGRIIRIERN